MTAVTKVSILFDELRYDDIVMIIRPFFNGLK